MAIELVPWDDCPAFAPMATAKLFCRVDPARVPSAITVLFSAMDRAVIVLAFTVLTLRMFVQFITLFVPLVKTYPVGLEKSVPYNLLKRA
jgi:hypothetical protein